MDLKVGYDGHLRFPVYIPLGTDLKKMYILSSNDL